MFGKRLSQYLAFQKGERGNDGDWGAAYDWESNQEVGKGRIEIAESSPGRPGRLLGARGPAETDWRTFDHFIEEA